MVEEAEIAKQAEEISEAHKHEAFNRMVAITVAVVALIMVLGKVKDENVMRAMMATQTEQLDDWNYYQARSLKSHVYKVSSKTVQLIGAMNPSTPAPARQQVAAALRDWEKQIKHEEDGQKDLMAKAKGGEEQYQELREQDHQFHFSEALLTLAITLFAVASLTRARSLFGLGLAVAVLGLFLELAGFMVWNVQLGFLKFLT